MVHKHVRTIASPNRAGMLHPALALAFLRNAITLAPFPIHHGFARTMRRICRSHDLLTKAGQDSKTPAPPARILLPESCSGVFSPVQANFRSNLLLLARPKVNMVLVKSMRV